ncbi:MAG: hydrogenase nickel incorporation protein HypB [Candidatus Bathyarchaeota archaeon]|nr:MAG: hydrogenase nickel incorporation protein HypB [Candidatus Bathyarchaeota archaeon]
MVRCVSRIIEAEEGETYDIELAEDLLKANRDLARENWALLKKHGIQAIDVMGSVGTGKTSLIEQIVQKLRGKYRIAAIAGDLTTTIDADLIASHGAAVIQINTGKECHLDANLVRKALQKIDLRKVDLIFIENVGNLICPAEFPLGSDKRIVVISLTEGPHLVIKHPFIFMEADIVVINKMDVADALGVNVDKLVSDVHRVNSNARVVKVSCKMGTGILDVINALDLK